MAVNATTPAVSIVGYRLVPPDQLLANPANPRRHPNAQREALRASLRALGWIAPVVQNVRTGNLIDGHARIEEALSAGVAAVPVIDVDLSPEQEALALAVYDPITSQAMYDREALDSLLRDVSTDETALQALLADVAQSAGLEYGDAGADPADMTDAGVTSQYGVIVVCASEAEQQTVYERLQGEGLHCRVVVV
jgi:hypothetical protein